MPFPVFRIGRLRAWLTNLLAVTLFAVAGAGGAQTGAAASPGLSSSPDNAAAEGRFDALRGLLGAGKPQPELLPPDEAFRIEVRVVDAQTLVARLSPAKDYYLYRDRISFAVRQPAGVSVVDVALPKGQAKDDPTFGQVEVYHQPIDATISLAGVPASAATAELVAGFQGCNDPVGVCYPPIEKILSVALPGTGTGTSAGSSAGALANPGGAAAPVSGGVVTPAQMARPAAVDSLDDNSRIGALFAGSSRWALIAAFFGFGVLLAFTPCMLPMIPILSGIIVGHGASMTRRHALGLSAVYVLAMAITYSLAGIAAGLAGTMLSAWLQNPWALGSFAAIFVLLSLSMFGLYELQLPGWLQTRLADAGRGVRGGRAAGAFAMGVLSAIIIGPCVAAPLAGALLYIGQTRDVVLGGSALFAMAIGMGVPLMIVGATAGSLLPKAGPWMESVKRVFGVTMLAVAIWMVSPVIPLVAQQLAWAALFIVSAIYLHALDPLPPQVPGFRRLLKGMGVIALLVGGALLIGALSGSRELLQPLSGLRGGEATAARAELPFQPVSGNAELDRQIAAAQGRPVMLDFWAEWCVSCKEMEHFTFSDARVQARLNNHVLLRADVTANNEQDQALLARFSLFGPPGIIFFDKSGQAMPQRVIGYQSADRFVESLDRISALMPAP